MAIWCDGHRVRSTGLSRATRTYVATPVKRSAARVSASHGMASLPVAPVVGSNSWINTKARSTRIIP